MQLHYIARIAPATRVGLITFDSDVRIIGDGRNTQIVDTSRFSTQYDLLKVIQGRYSFFLGSQIARTEHSLVSIVDHLESDGETVLSPAIFLAVHLAKQSGPGSRIILCTDGEASEGLGDSEDGNFYENLSVQAREASVSISVFCL